MDAQTEYDIAVAVMVQSQADLVEARNLLIERVEKWASGFSVIAAADNYKAAYDQYVSHEKHVRDLEKGLLNNG